MINLFFEKFLKADILCSFCAKFGSFKEHTSLEEIILHRVQFLSVTDFQQLPKGDDFCTQDQLKKQWTKPEIALGNTWIQEQCRCTSVYALNVLSVGAR